MPARDLATAALGWALALATWVAAADLPRSQLSDAIGAAGLPRGLAVLLTLVATLIAVRALWRARKREATQPEDTPRAGFREHAKAMGIVALGFGYVMLAPWLGYLPAAFLLLAATALYYGMRPSATLVVVSLAGAVLLWWVFAIVLGVSLP